METIKKYFYFAVCALALITVSIGSMLITTGLAFAEQRKKQEAAVETISILQEIPVIKTREL